MIPIPTNGILTTNDDYVPAIPAIKQHRGRAISIEVSGVFGGATVTAGYASSDAAPVFVVDVGDDNLPKTKTAAGRWITVRPASGLPAIRITGATETTAILVKIIDLLPR